MGDQNDRRDEAAYDGGVTIDYSGGDQDLAVYSRAVQIGTAGHLAVDFVRGGTNVVLSNLPLGIHRLAIKKIYQTGSTAAGVVLL